MRVIKDMAPFFCAFVAASRSSTLPRGNMEGEREREREQHLVTHLGGLMSASPCNSVPLCAAAIAFPSNAHDASKNESDLKREILMRIGRGKRERERRGKWMKMIEERET